VQINKVAAAQRQLDSAIRMFFQKEDELAVHTLSAAAFGILRDIIKKRGRPFTEGVLRAGIVSIAKQYAAGKLSPRSKALLEGTDLMLVIEHLADSARKEGDKFDEDLIKVIVSKVHEHKIWLSATTSFLKHADRDAEGLLATENLDNNKILMATCAAYLEVMRKPTREIEAYFAYWSAKNDQIDDLAEEVRQFARKLKRADEAQRYKLCSDYIRKNRQ
jgi:hypothetical protein